MNENYTDITLILDRSGSMHGVETDTIGGVNAFLDEQRKVDGKCNITTVLFDDRYEFLYQALDLKEVPELTSEQYFVRGGTALFDALGRAISEAGARFRDLRESDKPGRVLFVILTDGFENASKEFPQAKIAEMIKLQEETYDWDFIFLGADFDAILSYGGFLSKAGRSGNFNKAQIFNAVQAVGINTRQYRNTSTSLKNTVNLSAGVGDGDE